EPHQFADAVLTHFREQAFYYTLSPPRLGAHSVDDFLFDTRSGFCGHYASATALLLRQAGIPARVVGGYQGGLWYPEQNYLLVRQRDAHAWVEYLVDDRWHPLDPTAAIAPERILSGLDESLSDIDRQSLSSPWLARIPLVNQLRLQLLHLDYYWSVWVLGFNQQRQTAIWQSLYQAVRQYGQMVLIFFAGLLVLLTGSWLWFYYRQKKQAGSFEFMLRFIPALQHKPAGTSVAEALIELAAQNPEAATELQTIQQLYQQWIFANNHHADKELRKRLKTGQKTLKRLQLPSGFQT
ncbi:MAG: transglutaminase-like domain-containing protein, partial [Alkalimonas sp.]|nr:transglutaminase-like domain-containing protein [Alkalimonas sp.]